MDFGAIRRHQPVAADGGEREAAVVVPVVERSDHPQLLFIKRAETLSDHPGQMSFPGGKREPADTDLRFTALREGNEEVGLDPDSVTCIGCLDDIQTVTNFTVRPFVARVPDQQYRPCDSEVAEVAPLSLDELTRPENYLSELRDDPEHGTTRLHFFTVDGYTVWGATARILVQFLELTTDWKMPQDVDRRAGPDADLPV